MNEIQHLPPLDLEPNLDPTESEWGARADGAAQSDG